MISATAATPHVPDTCPVEIRYRIPAETLHRATNSTGSRSIISIQFLKTRFQKNKRGSLCVCCGMIRGRVGYRAFSALPCESDGIIAAVGRGSKPFTCSCLPRPKLCVFCILIVLLSVYCRRGPSRDYTECLASPETFQRIFALKSALLTALPSQGF